MNYKQTIDWLVKQVNKINDAGCGCTDCEDAGSGGTGLILPEFNFSYGKQHSQGADTEFFYENIVKEELGQTFSVYIRKYLLILDIPDFDKISAYSPVLLIDRYRRREKIGSSNNNGNYRKAGYKHETAEQAIENNRINEIPLTGTRNILDFNQENYFKFDEKLDTYALGSGKTFSYIAPNPIGSTNGNGVFVHLGFRLKLTIDGEEIITNQIGRIRMEFATYAGQEVADEGAADITFRITYKQV